MPVNKQKIIVILGPTASGKSELSLKLAKKYNGYIISADSRQIYKDMNIGTNKISGKWIKQNKEKIFTVNNIPHYLIDFINPNQEYTLANWQHDANKLLSSNKLNNKYDIPFIVGGTGLYISSLVENYCLPKGKIDKNLRNKLTEKKLTTLQQELKKLDPESYQTIDIKNKRKVVRVLEYFLSNRQSFTKNIKKKDSKYDILQIGISLPREKLYKKINKRVEQMIKQGLIAEVKYLIARYDANLPAMSGIGYKQIIEYLHGKINKQEAIELIKRDTRRYAKRQITWFKKDKSIHWIKNYTQADKLIKNWFKK